MTFNDLVFTQHPGSPETGVYAVHSFPNGYKASVVRTPHTYGGSAGLYELAVMDSRNIIVYDTPVTSDVLGWLDTDGVSAAMAEIAALPPR